MKKFHALYIFLVVCISACNHAPKSNTSDIDSTVKTTNQTAIANHLTAQHIEFLNAATIANLTVIRSSRKTLNVVQNRATINFATNTLNEHLAANDNLIQIAQSLGYELPTFVPSEKQAEIEKQINSRDDMIISKNYIKLIVNEHKATINLFNEKRKIDQPLLAKYIAKELPSLKQHLAQALNLQKDLSN